MTAAPPTRPGILTRELRWTWSTIGSGSSHLVPPRILSGSRTACGRPILGALAYTPPRGHRCRLCINKNGGVA